MDGADNFHSRLVAGMKILLPLGAIMLLSTMFLFSRRPAEDPTIPYSEIEDIAREQRITDPYFAGIADDGSVVAVSAEEVRPDPDRADAFEIERIRAEINPPDTSHVVIVAGHGRIDPRAQTAELDGLVRITASAGYEMETSGLSADLKTGSLVSIGALEAQAPFGSLEAGGLRIGPGQDGEGQQILFTDGVRLVYRPE